MVNANEEKLISENQNQNQSVYLDEKPSNNQLSELISNSSKYEKDPNTDILKYQKVSLMDVVLETIANSDLLKASREQVIQSEIKLKDAIAGYYPTLNFESETSRTRVTDEPKTRSFKYIMIEIINLF